VVHQTADLYNRTPARKFITIEDVATVVRGSSPRPQGDIRYYGGNIPRLMVSDVTRDGMYVTPKIDFLTEEGATKSRPMKKGDFIIAVSRYLDYSSCINYGSWVISIWVIKF
jgi:type I restriction enzyme S subunit